MNEEKNQPYLAGFLNTGEEWSIKLNNQFQRRLLFPL